MSDRFGVYVCRGRDCDRRFVTASARQSHEANAHGGIST
jgi:hypothetical protein